MITKKLLILSFILSIQILTSCSTPFYVEEVDGPIGELQKATSENLPGGLGAVSANQRNIYSKEYTTTEGKIKTPLIMRVSILGDRRPYAMQIQIRIPARTANVIEAFENGARYENEEFLAQRTYQKIKDQLNKRRSQKNLFDDFRPF